MVKTVVFALFPRICCHSKDIDKITNLETLSIIAGLFVQSNPMILYLKGNEKFNAFCTFSSTIFKLYTCILPHMAQVYALPQRGKWICHEYQPSQKICHNQILKCSI